MTNFLHRLVATVVRPESRLQPIAGSIFAPAGPRSVGGIVAPVADDPPASVNVARPVGERASLFDVDASDGPLLPPAVRGSHEKGPDEAATPPSREMPKRHANPDALPPVRAPDTEPGRRVEAVRIDGAAATPEPAMPTSAAAGAPAVPPRRHDVVAVRQARAVVGKPQAARREPDEVHIHIGRIEVAAAAPPAPPAAPSRVRRSLDLGEYLKRGNGRSG